MEFSIGLLQYSQPFTGPTFQNLFNWLLAGTAAFLFLSKNKWFSAPPFAHKGRQEEYPNKQPERLSGEFPFPWASIDLKSDKVINCNPQWTTLEANHQLSLAELICNSGVWQRLKSSEQTLSYLQWDLSNGTTDRTYQSLHYEVRCVLNSVLKPAEIYLVDKHEVARQERTIRNLRDQLEKSFLRNPAAMVISTIREGKILSVNDSFETLSGHSRLTIIGALIHELHFYADPNLRNTLSEKLQQDGYLNNEEITAFRKDGKLLHLLASVEPIEYEGETAILSTLLDITEWRQAEIRLSGTEKFLRNTLNALPNQIAILDATGSVIETNEAWNRFHRNLRTCPHDQCHLCREHLQIIGSIAGLTPPAIRELEGRLFEIATEEGQSLEFEYTICREANSTWIACRVHSFRDEGEIRVAIVQDDVTERKLSEMKIREAEEKYRQIFENAAEGIFQSTPDGHLKTVNPAMANIFGYSSPEDMLAHVTSIGNQLYVDPDERKQLLEKLTIDGRVIEVDESYRKKDGSIVLTRSNVRGIYNNDGTLGYIEGTLIDITDHERMIRELQAYTRQLEKTNYELDRFVYSVSHDLRAPITSLMGLFNLMANLRSPEESAKHLDMMRRCVTRLDHFIRQILQYAINARREPATGLTNLEELIDAVCTQLIAEDGKKLFELDYHLKCPAMINIDKARIEIILVNLISNAIKYRKPEHAQASIHIQVKRTDNLLHIQICDEGIGIAPDLIDSVFEMFFRSNHKAAGSGLGLYLVRETVRRMNGTVGVSSVFGEGTCFLISIPVN